MSSRAGHTRKVLPRLWASEDAACLGEVTGMFYKGDPAYDPEAATGVCGWCPVRQECLEHAMGDEGATGGRYGIRGGLLPEERRNLHRARVATARRERKRSAALTPLENTAFLDNVG